jgi:EmrB/QacA subfamily drug resistance transporter
MFAPMLGPVFGGFLVDQISWRWIFFINLPIGVLSFLFSWLVLREHKEPGAGRFDPLGFVFSGAGLAGILYALSRGADDGWTSPNVLITGLGGVVCFGLLVVVERRTAAPILDLGLYARRLFRIANLTGLGFFGAMFSLIFLLPLYLQQMRGLPAMESGLITMPQPIGQILMVQFTSRMYSRLGPRFNLLVGTGGVACVSALFLLVDLSTNLWLIGGLMFVRGLFVAFNMVSMQTVAFSAVPREKTGRAASLFSTLRQVSAALCVAAAGTVLTDQFQLQAPPGAGLGDPATLELALRAFHIALLVPVGFGLWAFCWALRVRDQDATSAHRPRGRQTEAAPVAAR